jgi:hypothetical protein
MVEARMGSQCLLNNVKVCVDFNDQQLYSTVRCVKLDFENCISVVANEVWCDPEKKTI